MKTTSPGKQSNNKIKSQDINDLNLSIAYVESLTNTGSWQYDMGTHNLTCSENFFRILGYKPFEFEPTPHNLLQFIPHQDQQQVKDFVKEEVKNNSLNELELKIRTKNNQEKIIICKVKGINQDNYQPTIAGTIHDITEDVKIRQQLEERSILAEMLIENSVDMIAAYNNDLHLIAWNKRCEQWFGRTKEEVLGKHILDVFPHFKDKTIMDQLEQVKQGKQFHFSETKYKKSEGFYESYFNPLKNKKGKILGILVIIHDITDIKNTSIKLKHLNQTLIKKNEEFERTNQELASFSYVASHDLQEPLRKIQTYSMRILEKEEENLSADGKEYLKRMNSACERMQVLIDDLLTFSRTSSTPRIFEKYDLNTLMKEVCSDLKESIDEKNASLHYQNLPEVEIIPFQFKQLLENLLLNSLKYHKQGIAPNIEIDATKTSLPDGEEEKSYHQITITDNGIGFEPEFAEKIFELFQRLHGKHEYPGTGLGLAICKKIIQNHNGFIKAEGKPGEGAIFTVFLPEN